MNMNNLQSITCQLDNWKRKYILYKAVQQISRTVDTTETESVDNKDIGRWFSKNREEETPDKLYETKDKKDKKDKTTKETY